MSENPLLPHAKLRELHALMLRTREFERKQRAKSGSREALLAATAIHLLPGDILCTNDADPSAESLAPLSKSRGLQGAGSEGLVLAYATAGAPEVGWRSGLAWAQEARLPLVLACFDATAGAAPRKSPTQKEPLTWATMTRFARQIGLPILAVDGEDAVAVYRVMQESAIRARYGGGPAVIWAVATPPATGLTRSQQPLARLERYLAVRDIKLPPRR